MKTLKKQKTLRPTTGKVREALFDILRGRIENTRFLDLYAGTGAVGINALEEGAAEVYFVEESRGNTKNIMDLVQKKRVSERAAVINKKVLSFIDSGELNALTFDIIFLDPPYHSDEIMQALTALSSSHLIKQEGIVIAEHFVKQVLPDRFDRLHKVKDYKYGDTVLSYYEAD